MAWRDVRRNLFSVKIPTRRVSLYTSSSRGTRGWHIKFPCNEIPGRGRGNFFLPPINLASRDFVAAALASQALHLPSYARIFRFSVQPDWPGLSVVVNV